MSRFAILTTFIAFACGTSSIQGQDTPPAAETDEVLEAKLEKLVEGFRGEVGIYVRHLGSGREAALAADEVYPTASMIKVPILLALFEKIEAGELKYDQKLTYDPERLYPGEDLLGSFKDGEKITLSKLVMLMLTMSDNTASLWCQELAGTGSAINGWLEKKGFEKTRMNSRTPGREEAKKEFGWGQTSPREMAELVVMIREGRAVSPAASEEMYRALCRSYWDGEALASLPPTVQAASKQGAVSRSRSEVVLVNAPSGDYVFCVITKNQEDRSWKADNAGFVLLRRASELLWQHFEPDSTWRPAPGVERYR
jgi:beta-lactamase class A